MNKKKTNSSAKATKANKPKAVAPVKLEVKLVSFTIGATIPTMMYGNILPSITVEARTMEDAKRAVMPVIEELYQVYASEGADGKLPKFINKANVTSTEKVVPQGVLAGSSKPAPAPATPPAPAPEKPKSPAQQSADELASDLAKSVAYTKAENAIKNSTSIDALNMIEEQIQKSVKLTADEKPALLTEVLKKRKEFDTL